jgi:hypothetical protein
MATNEGSIADVIKDAIRDAQDLVRSEIALAKAEAREEVRRLSLGVGMYAGAAVAGLLGLVFLLMTLAWGLSEGLGWPVWAGFGAVTALLLVTAAVLAMVARGRVTVGRHMPRTVDTLKENMEWIRARTS